MPRTMLRTILRAAVTTALPVLVLLAAAPPTPAQDGGAQDAGELMKWTGSAISWLQEQQVPNSVVPNPLPGRRHMPLGYEMEEGDPAFGALGARSFTYDAAVAACAFTAAGDTRSAEDILLTLNQLFRRDGTLWFAYNTDNAWPNAKDSGGALVRTGAVAWAGYAATFYLRMTADKDLSPAEERVRRQIRNLADQTAQYALERQITASDDPRRGLVTGGRGSYRLELGDDGSIREVYDPAPVEWASSEHNIDVYFLFTDLAMLTGEERYALAAEAVAAGLDRLWNADAGQLIQGIKGDGRRDTVLPLDTASWSAMFYNARGRDRRVATLLETVDRRFSVTHDQARGYVPYGDSPIYEDEDIAREYLGTAEATWKSHGPIWIEGSLGVATAHVKAGNEERATRILREMEMYRHDNGGFRYADTQIPYLFVTYPSVASTAWYVIAERSLHSEKVRRTFWSGM